MNAEDEELVAVTFRLPVRADAVTVHLVGEFNDWSRDATPLEVNGDFFSVVQHLRAGRMYRYKYLMDNERWENDWSADDYVANGFGGSDSVIDLSDPTVTERMSDYHDPS